MQRIIYYITTQGVECKKEQNGKVLHIIWKFCGTSGEDMFRTPYSNGPYSSMSQVWTYSIKGKR